MGTRPPVCFAFSFTRIDVDRIILFGGRHVNLRGNFRVDTVTNDIYILDTRNWTWSLILQQMNPGSTWPQGRMLHSTVPLVDPASIPGSNRVSNSSSGMDQKLLVLGGYGKRNHQTLKCYVLKVKNFKWEEILPPAHVTKRRGHSSAYYPTSGEAIIFTTGGGYEEFDQAEHEEHVEDIIVIFSGVRSL